MIEFPLLKPGKNSDTKKRICIASPDIVGPIRNGGIGTAYTSLGESLALAGHKVTFLYLLGNWCENKSIDYWKKFYSKKNINFVPLPDYEELNLEGFAELKNSYRAYLWLKNKDYDVIHFPEWQGLGYYSLCGKKTGLSFRNSTIVIGTHSPTLWHKDGNSEFVNHAHDVARDYMERKSVEMADVLISPSTYLLNWMLDNDWILPKQTYVHQNILPLSARNKSITEKKKRIDEVIFFGRLETRKGIELFCDAITRIQNQYKNEFKVTFLGKVGTVDGIPTDQYLKTKLENKIKYKIESGLNQFEAMEYLKQSNGLVVIPSLVENSPYTVLECLGANIPFIASNVGGIPELISDEDRDLACFSLKSDEIAKKILFSIENGATVFKPKIEFNETEKIWIQWHSNIKVDSIESSSTNKIPKVSVCLVHYNRPNYLKFAIESLKVQDYNNYEVILIDDGSNSQEALEYLSSIEAEFIKRNWKIVKQKNSYLGAARNTGVANSDGEYIMFMDDDNYAKPNEISTFINAIQYSKVDLLTCTLDKFKSKERPSDKSYYARWLPLGASIVNGIFENCFGDANCIVSRKAFNEVGGFTQDYGLGHEDWEFFAKANLQGLKHLVLPEALFWYRVDPNSMIHTTKQYNNLMRNLRPYLASVPTSLKMFVRLGFGLKAKNDVLLNNLSSNLDIKGVLWQCSKFLEKSNKLKLANDINLKLLKLARENNDKKIANKVFDYIAVNEKDIFSTYPANYNDVKKNNKNLLVSIIILSYNNASLLDKCMESIIKETKQIDNYEIIIVDNGSSDFSKDVLMRYLPTVKNMQIILNSMNKGFANGNNEAIKLARGKYLLFLNNDTEVLNGWLENLLMTIENDSSIGAVGSKLLYLDRTIQHAGVIITNNEIINDPLLPQHVYYKEKENLHAANVPKEYQSLTAACLLVRRNAFDAAEGFDENYWNGYEDVDLCFKIKSLGWKLVYQPKSVVIHHESQSGPERFSKVKENIKRLHTKWLGKIKPDVIIQRDGKIIEAESNQIRHYSRENNSIDGKNNSYPISIIFLTYNQLDYTKEFVDSINKFVKLPHELIIVDNASNDGTIEYLTELSKSSKNITLLMNENNLGFPTAVNQGITAAKGKYILIANNDIVLTEDSIENMVYAVESDSQIGLVGPTSNEVSGLQKDENAKYNSIEEMHEYAAKVAEKNKGEVLNFPRIAFLCTLIKKEVIEKIGGLDERFSPGNYEDDDFCLRAQLAGYKTVIAKDVFIHHYGSKSFKANGIDAYKKRLETNKKIFIDKWGVTPDELWLHNKTIKEHSINYPINKNIFKQYFDRTQIQLNDNELELAKQSIQKAVEHFTENDSATIAFYELCNIAGNIHLAVNDIEKAKEYFEQELNANPTSSSACKGLGDVFLTQENYEAAKTMYEWAVKNDPDNNAAVESLGSVNELLGYEVNHISVTE